ncbi:MAG TPA: glycoside hydrolase family 52 protein [Ktedonobacteraceae bacterium]|nr:glycoside hydrolase family 52 protein [Ktedonobacteraceae bacterium]
MRTWRPFVSLFLCGMVILSWLLFQLHVINASANTQGSAPVNAAPPGELQLDSSLPAQTFNANNAPNNVNAKFGSRFDFVVSPTTREVYSGTDGVYHDNTASYIVGIAPTSGRAGTSPAPTDIFHMGTADTAQGDTYVRNEKWIQGLDTSRWEGDSSDGSGMHITVDIIDTFYGEPGCIAISDCAGEVRDDTVPVFLVGVTLQNNGNSALTGNFLFGSNRSLPASNACVQHTTPGGAAVNVLSYSAASDATGGTLFLAGARAQWQCNTGVKDRAGLAWAYNVGAAQSQTNYMLIGGWNAGQNLFINTQLPAGCQQELLYPAREWSSENDVVDFAIDNLSTGDNLLGRAQAMENILIHNSTLSPQQRWIIADSLRSYKAASWLVGRQDCAGAGAGGYDAAVYEGAFGFLTTVDVLHEYGYFEINRVPWFFKSELQIVFKNVRRDQFGIYFQHDQGGDVNSEGFCAHPGKGIPTIRSTCYIAPLFKIGSPMPTEEDSNVALLTAYYVYITGDTALLTNNNNAVLNLIDAGMQHNQNVGDPATGIAYNAQDTNTTYDDQNDCLHNNASNAGNLYYQGLKEATAYRATAYIDGLIPADNYASRWGNDASKIENAMVREYNAKGFIPLAQNNNAYDNCNGRTVTTGEGLFYLHLIHQDTTMNQTLLRDLARQYPTDLAANTIASPQMISLESTPATGSQCPHNNACVRYEWFSKVMLSGIIADLVYAHNGCAECLHMDVTTAVFDHDMTLLQNYGDGLRSNGSDWPGHYYPRGMISWAFLNAEY